MEFKGTKGEWFIERTSIEDGDFQARILSNVGKVFHAGQQKDQIMIIVGEPTKINGHANIHSKENASIISCSLEMFEQLKSILDCQGSEFCLPSHINDEIKNLLKKATTI